MTIKQNTKILIALIAGIFIGSLGFGVSSADDTTTSSTSTIAVQGEILDVCIDKKTGVIRAATSCKKTERATVLGGAGAQGPKGDKGDTGATGAMGPMGPQGLTGATGSVTGLRTENIEFLSRNSFGCPGFGTGLTVVTDVRLSTFLSSTTLVPTTIRLYGCTATVYVR